MKHTVNKGCVRVPSLFNHFKVYKPDVWVRERRLYLEAVGCKRPDDFRGNVQAWGAGQREVAVQVFTAHGLLHQPANQPTNSRSNNSRSDKEKQSAEERRTSVAPSLGWGSWRSRTGWASTASAPPRRSTAETSPPLHRVKEEWRSEASQWNVRQLLTVVRDLQDVNAFSLLPPAAHGGESPVGVASRIAGDKTNFLFQTRYKATADDSWLISNETRCSGSPVNGSPSPHEGAHAAGTHQHDLQVTAAGMSYGHGDGHVLQSLHSRLLEVSSRNWGRETIIIIIIWTPDI